jgi:glucose-6-phosphate isomerase
MNTSARSEEHWSALISHYAELKKTRISALFAANPNRFEQFSATFDDILYDFSKEKIDEAALQKLFQLADSVNLSDWRYKLLSGAIVNGTEARAARHNMLRAADPPMAGVAAMRKQFLDFAEDVRTGRRLGAGREPFTDVVNIGIGGSSLGPRLVVEALKPFSNGPQIHFVSNVDPWNVQSVLHELDPARTLVLCASKSFKTQETVLNFRQAVDWLRARLGPEAWMQHACAITARPDIAGESGIPAAQIFQFWDWTGGRFSVWSSIGLSSAIALGADQFQAFLAGATDADSHFETEPWRRNIPVLMAIVGVWRRNIERRQVNIVSPYEDRLDLFPDYLQQLEMESNGKGMTREGTFVQRATAPFIFGAAGTNVQHSYFQMLHQGPDSAPVDFLVGVETATGEDHAQNVLISHCLAQSQALMIGRSAEAARDDLAAASILGEAAEKLAPHLVCPGDRSSTTLMYHRLDPRTLGRLMALYEHKTFVQAVLWGIECFDQWGVELGKKLADALGPILDSPSSEDIVDPSTSGLMAWRRRLISQHD